MSENVSHRKTIGISEKKLDTCHFIFKQHPLRRVLTSWSSSMAPLLVCLAILLIGPPGARCGDEVDVRVVKYGELAETILRNRGKVIIVDFWADWCIPCKREFPNLVKLHEKYAKDGLVALSVNLDDSHKNGIQQTVLKFLRSQKASFMNFILDESPEFWQKKFNSMELPFVYVFNRQGKWHRYQGGDHYSEIQTFAIKLLGQR
jgi:thiol-disulfide isomerase/thioredoxin